MTDIPLSSQDFQPPAPALANEFKGSS